MENNIYSIRDKKANYYHQPFTMSNDVLAKRTVAMSMENKQQSISFEPEAFDIYKIGTYNDESGKITPCEPVFIENCKTLERKQS